jgi:hypothetical protein
MRIFVYVSETSPDILGFTSDEWGANLPAGLGPWRQEEMPGVLVVAETGDAISEAVESCGFCIVDGRSTSDTEDI